jgi:glycosyltransferase involved in cell wall biosynthesis
MIRVAFLCDTLEVGGQERGCLDVLRRLDRRRFSPSLFAFRPGGLLSEAEALGVPVTIGHDKPGTDPSWTDEDEARRRSYDAELERRLRRERTDVCLVYAWASGVAAATAAGVPAIVERVDGLSHTSRVRDKSACQRILCESKMIRTIILAQRELFGCHPRQVVVVPNGIDLDRFDPRRYDSAACRQALEIGSDEFVIGTVARLAPEKNLVHLIRAAHRLIDRCRRDGRTQRIRVVIAGPDRGARAELETEAARLGVTDHVRFLGLRVDVPEVLRALDVFVSTSLYEGSPFALLEAMAMGLPVVATPVGGVPEMIAGNGYLVGVLHPEQTCRALVELIESPELRARLGRRSRASALGHDLDRMVRRYESVLIDALEEARSRPK